MTERTAEPAAGRTDTTSVFPEDAAASDAFAAVGGVAAAATSSSETLSANLWTFDPESAEDIVITTAMLRVSFGTGACEERWSSVV